MNLNYSSSVIVRPTVLKYCNLTLGQEETFATDSMPADLLVEIMNKYDFFTKFYNFYV